MRRLVFRLLCLLAIFLVLSSLTPATYAAHTAFSDTGTIPGVKTSENVSWGL